MNELTGLELRRAALEALGWEKDRDGDGWWHSPACRYDNGGNRDYSVDKCNFPSHRTEDRLPAIESDPAVSEPIFLAFCEKEGYDVCLIVRARIKVGRIDLTLMRDGAIVIIVGGKDPSEARARAIVAASSASSASQEKATPDEPKFERYGYGGNDYEGD